MLKFDVALCSIRDNVAHKVLLNVADELPRYGFHFFVASELASDVERFMPDKAHVVRTKIRLRRISTFLPPARGGVSSGGLL